LWYYATLLSLKYNKNPHNVGFIDWTKGNLVNHTFNLEYVIDLRYKVLNLKKKYYKIKSYLEKCKGESIPIEDLGLDCNPTNNCIFCPIVLSCSQALERKKNLIDYMEGIKNRREVNEYLKDIIIDESKLIQDITL
jgi:hypothetical protein